MHLTHTHLTYMQKNMQKEKSRSQSGRYSDADQIVCLRFITRHWQFLDIHFKEYFTEHQCQIRPHHNQMNHVDNLIIMLKFQQKHKHDPNQKRNKIFSQFCYYCNFKNLSITSCFSSFILLDVIHYESFHRIMPVIMLVISHL